MDKGKTSHKKKRPYQPSGTKSVREGLGKSPGPSDRRKKVRKKLGPRSFKQGRENHLRGREINLDIRKKNENNRV